MRVHHPLVHAVQSVFFFAMQSILIRKQASQRPCSKTCTSDKPGFNRIESYDSMNLLSLLSVSLCETEKFLRISAMQRSFHQ